MKFLPPLIFIFLLVVSCSTTESTQESSESGQAASGESLIPNWYDSRVTSATDSASFNGYALAVSTDSLEALKLAMQTSAKNLRFEIDKYVEEIRVNLSENNSVYSTPDFILQLRNAIRVLPLEESEITNHYEETSEDVFYVYTRSSLPINSLQALINSYISDDLFLEKLKKQ